jgi:WD40 repeat protein
MRALNVVLFGAAMTLPCASVVSSAEPPAEPFFVVENGMHVSAVRAVSVDAKNRYLATGSEDKTVRVWRLDGGQLEKVLRPPIGHDKEGEIYAVAMSPDGRMIACGGYTGVEWDGSFSIYVFDRESGVLTKRITGLPRAILRLTFTKDGKYLLAAMEGNGGLRVIRLSDYAVAAEDTTYEASTVGLDTDAAGHVVTASLDGFVRLYNQDFQLTGK